MFTNARTAIRNEMENPTILGSLLLGTVATLISFALVDVAYSYAVQELVPAQVLRAGMRFGLPSSNWMFVLVCLAAGSTAFNTRLWVLPLIASLFFFGVSLPFYTVEGAISKYRSIIEFNMELALVALVLNFILAVLWIHESKLKSSADNPDMRTTA